MGEKQLLPKKEMESVRQSLNDTHAELVIRGLLEDEAREKLKQAVTKEFGHVHRGDEEKINFIVQETVGTGVIEEIIKDESITDIGYNGKDLIIESNDRKIIYDGSTEISENYIIRLITKFANVNGKEFTPKTPIFDGKFMNIRINAIHSVNTVSGTTMSLRVVRPRLALQKKNFSSFAPDYIYNLFEAVVKLKTNIVISGETGTGKTELQKLLASFIPFKDRIVLIEDVAETFLKEMFPDKDIYSLVTSEGVSITKLVVAALRNNPRWILVSETRMEEAFEMIQAVISGHKIITTLHAVNARAIPDRLVNMSKMGYSVSEKSLEGQIRRYFDFGVHIERVEYRGKVIRYLAEIVEFNEEGDQTVFEQEFVNGKFLCKTKKISDELQRKLKNRGLETNFPENNTEERIATASGYITRIPVAKEVEKLVTTTP